MADIAKSDIKLMQSQRLDETDQGGGQMTSHEVVDGAVNNLFPDISRLDRVYGRVSMRKAFIAVQTSQRETYYGSHVVLTKQVDDPNVSVCFFSNQDWFDTRSNAQDRVEAYLVKGPRAQMSLWSDHYAGTSSLNCFTHTDWPEPEIGDVLVLRSSDGLKEQFVRITDLTSEIRTFYNNDSNHTQFNEKIIFITTGSQLLYDFEGEEVTWGWSTTNDNTEIYETVAADASRYYGISTLVEAADSGDLSVRADSLLTHLVPSAASEVAILDAQVGNSAPIMVQAGVRTVITRSISASIVSSGKLYLGEGVYPGSFVWSGGMPLSDNAKGDVYSGSTLVGTIDYTTGIISFGSITGSFNMTGTASYVPAANPVQITETGAIPIAINNRGYVYTFSCNPIPEPGSLKVEFLANSKWYTMQDLGDGQIKGIDDAIGSGSVNHSTGSVSVTLGAMPDVDSAVMFFWAKSSPYYDFSGETLPLRYIFSTQHQAVARNTFVMTWLGNAAGSGPAGEYGIVDNGNALLVVATYNSGTSDWEIYTPGSPVVLGSIKYATGEVDTLIHSTLHFTPVANEVFTIQYNYGDPETESFFAPPRDMNGHITVQLTNTPIVPGTFRIEWHTDITQYDPETRFNPTRDPAYIFRDDGSGHFSGDANDGTTNWIQGTVNYTTGVVLFHPDRTTVFPHANYEWRETAWLHPGVIESRVYTGISYLPTGSLFPPDGTVVCSYCPLDGSNLANYSGTIAPSYIIKENSGLELLPGSTHIYNGTVHIIDGGDGKLYTHSNGVTGVRTQVGTINYSAKKFSISEDIINLKQMIIQLCTATSAIDPIGAVVFRTPGSPIRSGSLTIRATTGGGTLLEGTTDFSGNIVGEGIFGTVNFVTGLCKAAFGTWVPDDASAQAEEWYNATATDGAGNVWKPYSVRASTILINCVITSYLPLDAALLGMDPVRLPLDGKVPIFRDGYIVLVHNPQNLNLPHPLSVSDPLVANQTQACGRTNVEVLEVYSMPTAFQLNNGTQTCPVLINDAGNYTINLTAGTVTFLTGFTLPKDSEGTKNQLVLYSRIEDMCLVSDAQITGHLALTRPLVHSYPANTSYISSVLPVGDLQSRAYNEFEQNTWTSVWSDALSPGTTQPIASFNFVDYPITVTNKPSIKERWLIQFQTFSTVRIVGENFGVLAENIEIANAAGAGKVQLSDGNYWICIQNRQFSAGDYYFLICCAGFGGGWAAGNCIRFNQDAANYPVWFVRTTLQAPATEPVDHYTIQIRGDSS